MALREKSMIQHFSGSAIVGNGNNFIIHSAKLRIKNVESHKIHEINT